jgi:hypothetical protein
MIAEPPKLFWSLFYLCFKKENAMSLVKSIPETPSTYVNIERAQLGSLFSSPFAISTSPKTQELRIRHESRLAAEADLKPTMAAQESK